MLFNERLSRRIIFLLELDEFHYSKGKVFHVLAYFSSKVSNIIATTQIEDSVNTNKKIEKNELNGLGEKSSVLFLLLNP